MNTRRTIRLGIAALALLSMIGCANRWERPLEPDGKYCFMLSKKRNSLCTAQPAPAAATDADAKRFAPDPNAVTVYVVRHRWQDKRNEVTITVDQSSSVATIPESFVRLRLQPGSHVLALTWEGKTATQAIAGKAGDVLFVKITGSDWSWGGSYVWDTADAEDAKQRVLKSRLIADVSAQ